jgi:hypothetical protein
MGWGVLYTSQFADFRLDCGHSMVSKDYRLLEYEAHGMKAGALGA